jgi:hypothetical protein
LPDYPTVIIAGALCPPYFLILYAEVIMNEFLISLKAENGTAKVDFTLNGQPVDGLFAVNFIANTRSGELQLNGIRFKRNDSGQFFVDPVTKDTALEGIDLLALLETEVQVSEKIKQASKNLDFELQNIKDTSTVRARNLIAERMN